MSEIPIETTARTISTAKNLSLRKACKRCDSGNVAGQRLSDTRPLNLMTSPSLHPRNFQITPALALSFLVLLSFAPRAMSQGARRIAQIDFEGLHNLTTDNVIAMTGLKAGDSFSVAALDSA